MKILAISTSPRAGGNTDLLVDAIVGSAAEAGAEVEKIATRDFDVGPCIECNACRKTGRCVIQDDMQQMYPKLLDADRIVFATPVYFLGPCAQAKAFIDRCQAIWSLKFVLERPVLEREFPLGRLGYLVATGGTRGQKVFECCRRSLRNVFSVLGVKYDGELVYRQIDEKGAILEHPTAMHDAHEFGKKIAEEKN
ncbi:MAG: flavodoxin family protein [Planctomycetes bacterium]|nr:flavodoxin family protein [Planctomycetota bacterium]